MQRGNDENDANQDNSTEGLAVSPSSRKKLEKVAENNNQLPCDVLHVICQKLDFDDLFEFAGVCKNWRTFHKSYWKDFMASQSPLLVQTSSYAKKAFFFFSIPHQKVYRSKMDYFWGLSYCGSSSGYLIMTGANSILLMNPFTRRKKVINTSTVEENLKYIAGHALLAFAKGSKEFIIVFLSKITYNLHVYQSQKSCWVTYSREGNPWRVVDFVVLQNMIYALTDVGKIGVLGLNSASIKFLDVKNTPNVTFRFLKLVNCDGQLLVVHFEPREILNVYKINLLTMEYVKLENLGDIALFYAMTTNCYALVNPGRWGYENNSVYCIDCWSAKCEVYSSNNNKLQKCIEPTGLQAPRRSSFHWLDWCFQNQHNEVDYSLVE